MEKGYISLECKREEHAEARRETRESDRRRSDEDSPGVAGEEQHGMENEGEKAGGKASDETNELDGRRRRASTSVRRTRSFKKLRENL